MKFQNGEITTPIESKRYFGISESGSTVFIVQRKNLFPSMSRDEANKQYIPAKQAFNLKAAPQKTERN